MASFPASRSQARDFVETSDWQWFLRAAPGVAFPLCSLALERSFSYPLQLALPTGVTSNLFWNVAFADPGGRNSWLVDVQIHPTHASVFGTSVSKMCMMKHMRHITG